MSNMKTEKIITIVADSHLMADNIARAIGATPAGEYHYAKEVQPSAIAY